jgi:CRP-like cAMP-binding protein
MYIIESGSVNIYFGEDKKLLAVLSRGDFFGEMALLLDTPRTARSVATSPTNLLGFFRPDLFSLIETLPETGNKILMHLAQMIAERLKHTSLENQQLRIKLNKLESKNSSKAK